MTGNKKAISQISNTFKRFDLFGDSIGFKVNGNNVYNSVPGAIISLCIMIVVTLYGVMKFGKLSQREDTIFYSSSERTSVE